MKKQGLVILAALFLCLGAYPQVSGGGGGDPVGSLPKTDLAETGVNPCAGPSAKVKPGQAHTNGDGVTVENDTSSSGDAAIDPAGGTTGCCTNTTTKSGFEGGITGLDVNDTVGLGSSNKATVTGNGGSVALSGGSTVTVTNTGGPGATPITVIFPSGNTAQVPPGSSTTFNT